MYSKYEGQMGSFRRIELTSEWAIIWIITKKETGIKEVYKCPSDLPNHYPFRNLIFSKIFILSIFVCGNKDFLNQMTLILLKIYDHYQVIIILIFNNTTNVYKNITEAISDEQISNFICTPGSSENSTIIARVKNPKPVVIESQDGTFLMTHICVDVNDKFYTIICINNITTTKVYETDTENFENWNSSFLTLKINEICIHWRPLQQSSFI